jgi:RNA-binding protein
MPLSTERKKHLRSLGHGLKPVVTVAGKGLSDNVVAELDRALSDHELIKVKLQIEDRDERQTLAEQIATQLNTEIAQTIGKIVLLYRPAKKPNNKLSNLKRFKP